MRPLKLLVLGGTGFVGPHIVEAALNRGHDVTLFNRGRSNRVVFPKLERLEGDRDPNVGRGLTALHDRQWDAVVDTSGYVQRLVRASAELLATRVDQYLFISSIAAYADPSVVGITEAHPLAVNGGDGEAITDATYGPFKAQSENVVEACFGERSTALRCGFIVGPGDPFDRFTYWVMRVSRGGEVLAPGTAEDPVQQIDVRDLGEFAIRCLEARACGPLNVVGPRSPLSMGELLYRCKAAVGGDATFRWVDARFLEQRNVRFPTWTSPEGRFRGFGTISNAKAVAAGLTFRPVATTVRETKQWFETQPDSRQARLRRTLDSDFETQTLNAWRRWRAAERASPVSGMRRRPGQRAGSS